MQKHHLRLQQAEDFSLLNPIIYLLVTKSVTILEFQFIQAMAFVAPASQIPHSSSINIYLLPYQIIQQVNKPQDANKYRQLFENLTSINLI